MSRDPRRLAAAVVQAASRPAGGGQVQSTLPAGNTRTAAPPAPRQSSLDAYSSYVQAQPYATPKTPPKGKWRGFANQGQLYAAIQGGATDAFDAAQQYASDMSSKAHDFGRQTADDTVVRQREMKQAWDDAQRQHASQLKAQHDEATRALGAGRDALNAEWAKGYDPEAAAQFATLPRNDQVSANRWSAMAGMKPLPIYGEGEGGDMAYGKAGPHRTDVKYPWSGDITDKDVYERYVQSVASAIADRRSSPDALANRGGGGPLGAVRAHQARLREGGFDPKPADGVSDLAGFSPVAFENDLKAAVDPRLEAARTDTETAGNIASTPISQYAQMIATNQYGLDPNLARGQFDEGLDTLRFKEERDAASIQQNGMPYSEYQAQLTRQQNALDDATQTRADASAQAQLDEVNLRIAEQTGTDAKALSQAANLPIDVLGQVVASPDYQDANAQLQAAIAGDDGAAFDSVLSSVAAYDPQLFRVIQAQYADYVNGGFDPLDNTTWR